MSVITPSYNQGAFIRRTIESVLSQGVPALEYVVVDGGSTDQTLRVLRDYGDQVSWISEPDAGQAEAVNKGILRTTGPIIGWLNSDDIYYPHALESVVEFFQRNSEVDVVYGNANHIDSCDRVIESFPAEPWNFERLKQICFIPQPAAFVRRAAIQRFGMLNPSVHYATDYDYWFRLALGGAKFRYLPRLLAATRLHPQAATIARRVECHREINDVTLKYLGRTPDRWLFNYAHAVVEAGSLGAQPNTSRNAVNLGRRTPPGQLSPEVLPTPTCAESDLSAEFPKPGQPVTTLVLAATAVYAAIRWNHRVSAHMLTTLLRWVVADTLRPLGIRYRHQ